MPSPQTAALATLRPDLADSFEEYGLDIAEQGFVATDVLPVIEVMKASGVFGRIPVAELLQKRESLRAPGAAYNRGDWTFETSSFACREHGLEEPVDDREATLYSNYFMAEAVSAARARHGVMLNAELRASALIFNSTTWTGSALTTGVTNEWDDVANADPAVDVLNAMIKVWDGSGLWPNALIINRLVFQRLKLSTKLKDLMKYAGFKDPDPGSVTVEAMAQALGIDRIIIAGAPQNSALEGAAVSITPAWSNEFAMIAKIAVTADIREPCVGRTFHWGEDGSTIGGSMETYREESHRSNIIRVRHDVDEIVLYKEAAHLLSNITA